MLRTLLILCLTTAFLRADTPQTPEQIQKQIDELQAKLKELKSGAKKPLTIAEASTWKMIRQAALSRDGQWFAYRVGPMEGETECVLKNLKDGKETRFYAGASGLFQFSHDTKWFACTVMPYVKPGTPVLGAIFKTKIVLVNLETKEKKEFDNFNSFAFNGEAATHIALMKVMPEGTTTGGDLLLRELGTASELLYGNVIEFSFNKKGQWLVLAVDALNQAGNGVHLRDMKTGNLHVIESGKAGYRSISWHDDGNAFAMLKSVDHDDYDKWQIALGFANLGAKPEKTEYNPKDDKSFPTGYGISANRGAAWLDNLEAISFGIAEMKKKDAGAPKKEVTPAPRSTAPATTVVPKPAASVTPGQPDLVIWHWKDERLQPMQQVQATTDKLQTYLSLYRVKEKKFIQLADKDCRSVTIGPKGKFALGGDASKYQYMSSLDGKRFSDVYLIDLASGKKTKALEKLTYLFSISPTGTHLLYYVDGHFQVMELATLKSVNITKPITETRFIDADDDHNVKDPPSRPLGWSRDGKHVLLSDEWDLWKVNADGNGGVNLTANGKKDSIRYTDFLQWDRETPKDPGFDFSKPALVKTYGEWTKKEGITRLEPDRTPEVIQWADCGFGMIMKAQNADVYVTTKSTVKEYPDYYESRDGLKTLSKITNANPQQSDYLWCSGTKLIDYTGVDGKKLQGALYLPADYKPGQKYPTIVYIYEKLSENIHNYLMPGNMGFSPAIYTSNGYAVFMPDITYRLNDPGISAVECILPALDAAIASGVVDGDKLGLQGHSWGGYQTAFLVTQTNRFKAAVAGAPLTDLVSMYSSVYWNSGSANQPIFESSQGRFTGGYWEQQDAYIRNSPVFHATKVATPLVILHNDKDGAVDFTQGIEYYNTLRRLQKPVVMLQYKGENHGLVKPENRKDYSVRMREFFDHHLMGKPAPDWWTDGVPHLKLDDHLKKRKQ